MIHRIECCSAAGWTCALLRSRLHATAVAAMESWCGGPVRERLGVAVQRGGVADECGCVRRAAGHSMTISTVQYNSRTHQAMSGGQDGVYAQCTRTRMLCLTRLQSDCVCGAIVNQRTRWPVLQWRNRTIGASNTSCAWRCPPIDRHGLHHLTHQLNHETLLRCSFLALFRIRRRSGAFLIRCRWRRALLVLATAPLASIGLLSFLFELVPVVFLLFGATFFLCRTV